jgi:putative membrane protein
MADIVLEIVHHVAVFTLVGIFAAEFVLIGSGMSGARVRQLAAIDGAYGGLAALIIVVGFTRVIWGDAGWQFYVYNWVFWAKIAAFVLVGGLSGPVTVTLRRWSKTAAGDAAFTPPAAELSRVRALLNAQLAIFPLIPIFAALMARGVGL